MSLQGSAVLYEADFSSPRIAVIAREMSQLRKAAKSFNVVILQVSPYHWARGSVLSGLLQATWVHLALFRKSVVVMHDTPDRGVWLSSAYARAIGLVHWALARQVVYLSNAERSQAGLAGKGRHVQVVPHYIETRSVTPLPEDMGLPALRLGVVGFIDRRKDPLFTLEVLKCVDGATLTFLGGPLAEDEAIAANLRREITWQGLEDRVTITGYLTEEELDAELGRIHIGLCLYRRAATSGSLSTLLAARRPIVASALPIFREYAAALPRAIMIVDMDPEIVARAIVEIAGREPDWPGELDDLLRTRSLANFGREMWRAGGTSPPPS
jgi:glycosyltransferase involved in cell wall biosynthesis